MNKFFFENLLERLELLATEQQLGDNNAIINFIDESRELAKFGEIRIALENLLENMIEIGIVLPDDLIEIATQAFGENIPEYDRKLLDFLQNK